MEQLEAYIKEMDKDVEIDEFNIKETQMKLPALKHKWVGRLIRHKGELGRLQSRRDNTIKTVAKELIDTATYQVSLATAQKAAEKQGIESGPQYVPSSFLRRVNVYSTA